MKVLFIILLSLSVLILPINAKAQTGKLLFGLGPEASDAINMPLVKDAPIKMLTSWYNGPKDLEWMSSWKTTTIPQTSAKGYTHHLIIFANDNEKPLKTPYGDACGREYPLTDAFQEDVKKLADIFKDAHTLYVTVFTEFQTYPCKDNQWKESENYYKKLKQQYTQARLTFKKIIGPNTKVSIGWGGWQARYDDKANGGGRSLFPYFEDSMKESDFQSFQSMQSDHNIQDIREMTTILSKYGPVMLAHYKPDNRSQTTFDNDLKALFTDAYINEITAKGLFAMSFMDHTNLSNSNTTYELTKNAVKKYSSAVTSLPLKAKPTPTPSPTHEATPTATPIATSDPQTKIEEFTDYSSEMFLNKNNNWFEFFLKRIQEIIKIPNLALTSNSEEI